MARSVKTGLDYFPLDVDILENDKLWVLEAKHGNIGFALLIKLFIKIYRDKGYYIKWTDREAMIFAHKHNVDINEVNELINTCLCEHLFDKSIHQQYHILTSAAIQSRYLKACERRKRVEIARELALIDIDVYKNAVYVDINAIDELIGTQSKVKYSKEKKRNRLSTSGKNEVDDTNDEDESEHSPDDETRKTLKQIYSFWNDREYLISHRKCNSKMESAVNARLENFTVEELKEAISEYNRVLGSDEYFLDYKWTLDEFLSRGEGEKVERMLQHPESYRKSGIEGKGKNRQPYTEDDDQEGW